MPKSAKIAQKWDLDCNTKKASESLRKWCWKDGPAPQKTRFSYESCCIFAVLQHHQQLRKMTTKWTSKWYQILQNWCRRLPKSNVENKHKNRHQTNAWKYVQKTDWGKWVFDVFLGPLFEAASGGPPDPHNHDKSSKKHDLSVTFFTHFCICCSIRFA